MNTNSITGINFSLSDGIIDFFGAKGRIFDDKWWGFNVFGGGVWLKTSPDSMIPAIRACIQMDVDSGNADKVAQIHLCPSQGVVLFLEGKIPVEKLTHALETSASIDIPGVIIEGRTLTVRVFANKKQGVATADNEGKIL